MDKEIIRIGTGKVNHNDLSAFEAITMGVVAILAITVGTIYGTMLN